MAWRFVKQPNGLLARFSEVVDDFTEYDMTEDEAIDVALDHVGRKVAAEKIRNAQLDLDPVTQRAGDGLSRFNAAIETVRFHHGEDIAREREQELSRQAK